MDLLSGKKLAAIADQLRAAGVRIDGVRLIGDVIVPDYSPDSDLSDVELAEPIVAGFNWDDTPPQIKSWDDCVKEFQSYDDDTRFVFWVALGKQVGLDPYTVAGIAIQAAVRQCYDEDKVQFEGMIQSALLDTNTGIVFTLTQTRRDNRREF